MKNACSFIFQKLYPTHLQNTSPKIQIERKTAVGTTGKGSHTSEHTPSVATLSRLGWTSASSAPCVGVRDRKRRTHAQTTWAQGRLLHEVIAFTHGHVTDTHSNVLILTRMLFQFPVCQHPFGSRLKRWLFKVIYYCIRSASAAPGSINKRKCAFPTGKHTGYIQCKLKRKNSVARYFQ